MISNKKLATIANTICIIIMMFILFFATAHEVLYEKSAKYYSLALFFALIGFFVTNVDVLKLLKEKNMNTWILGIAGALVPVFLWLAQSRWGALFTGWNVLLVFYLADKIKLSLKQIVPVYIMQAGILFVFLLSYPKTYNPNHCGMYLLIMFIVTMILLLKLKELKPMKYVYSIFHILLAGVVIYEIMLYRARTALVGLILFELFWLFLYKGFGKKKWFTYLLVSGLTVGDLVFTLVYVNMYKVIGDYKMPFFNKRIMSGRQYAWADFWEGFLSRPLTGIGSDFDKMMPNGSGLEAHNALLSLLAVHGVILFVMMLYFIIGYLTKSMLKMEITSWNAILMAGLLTIFVISVFENALVAGQYATFAFLFAITYNSFRIEKQESKSE